MEQLYCSGSQERLCSLSAAPQFPGECLWRTSDGTPVDAAHMADRKTWNGDRWDPVAGGAITSSAWHEFDGAAAARCVKDKHVYIVGESTTRDLYYNFASFAGVSPDRSACMNIHGKLCQKTALGKDGSTRMSYQFISAANASRELEIAHNLTHHHAPPDAVFVYCMMYDWLKYLSHSDDPSMGDACFEFIERAIREPFGKRVPVYLLGPIYPPNWVSPYDNRTQPDSVMARIFRSIDQGMGITCARRETAEHSGGGGGAAAAGGRRDAQQQQQPERQYKVVSSRGIRGPLDRFNVVGHRKKDMIHPFDNAHRPNVQMMFNYLCPGGGGFGDGETA